MWGKTEYAVKDIVDSLATILQNSAYVIFAIGFLSIRGMKAGLSFIKKKM